jgi:flavorubredoxin
LFGASDGSRPVGESDAASEFVKKVRAHTKSEGDAVNIGIIVHSETGNTLSVARKLEEKLVAAGHSVTLEHLKIIGEARPGRDDFSYETLPDTGEYDALVFASPAQAFQLAVGMGAYLKQVPALQGKQVGLLVTEAFPWPWLGGNRAIRQMTAVCEEKGATVSASGIVNWMNRRREQMIVDVTDRLSAAF